MDKDDHKTLNQIWRQFLRPIFHKWIPIFSDVHFPSSITVRHNFIFENQKLSTGAALQTVIY